MYITSLLDTDLYKFTMMLFAHYMYPNVQVEYAFKCRSNVPTANLYDIVNSEVDELCKLKLKDDELQYLIDNVDTRFNLNSFRNFKLNRKAIKIRVYDGNELDIRVKGSWWEVILFEVYVLAIVNEAYTTTKTKNTKHGVLLEGDRILTEKIKFLNSEKCKDVKIIEFGTRRRASSQWQFHVLDRLYTETSNILGTSNVLLAKNFGIKPFGTMAHEAFQVMQGIVHPVKSQVELLNKWHSFWGDKYLVALTDIFVTAKFIKDFNFNMASAYTGLRHDSGNPYVWGDQMIAMYNKFRIDPMTKTLTFSDGLDVEDAHKLCEYFKGRINTVFGIGTKLTNDFGSAHNALQVVMKIVKVDGIDVAKLSNSPGKTMCENMHYVQWLVNAIQEDINNG